MYLLRKGAYRDFLHAILKAHTISNMLVSKSICTEERGEKVMTATNMCSNFGSKWSSPPKRKCGVCVRRSVWKSVGEGVWGGGEYVVIRGRGLLCGWRDMGISV